MFAPTSEWKIIVSTNVAEVNQGYIWVYEHTHMYPPRLRSRLTMSYT